MPSLLPPLAVSLDPFGPALFEALLSSGFPVVTVIGSQPELAAAAR